jgi:hypothetical protein
MLFAQKTEPQIMACVPRGRLVVGLGVWLTHVGEVACFMGGGGGDAPDILAWGVGGHTGAVQPGREWSARASSNIWKPRASIT